MKHTLAVLTVQILASLTLQAAEESLSSLPPAVQKTARGLIGSARVEEVEDTFENGQRAYEVEFERDGKKMAIVISPAGKLIQTECRLSVGDTPPKIKEAVEKKSPGATISHIKKVEKNGQTIFEISVRTSGKTQELKLDARGNRFRNQRIEQAGELCLESI